MDIDEWRTSLCKGLSWEDIIAWAGLTTNHGKMLRSGGKYRVLCCFHTEKHPSLWLFPSGGFICRGCGIGGDIADFVCRRVIGICYDADSVYLLGREQQAAVEAEASRIPRSGRPDTATPPLPL